MADRYKKVKWITEMTPLEIMQVKRIEFDFDENLLGACVICDPSWYTELPPDCKVETIVLSFKNGEYRADAVCDAFVDKSGDIYVSENEMNAGICIE